MGKIRRTFTTDFKERIAQLVLSSSASISEICKEHQLTYQTVQLWVAKAQSGAPLGQPSSLEKTQAREIEKLHAKIGQMAVEIDLLKKFHAMLRARKKESTSIVTPRNLDQFQKRVNQ